MTTFWRAPCAVPDEPARRAAAERQAQLTKPRGSLGRLERLAVDFAGWQGRVRPELERVAIGLFAADHGVASEGVSAYPQAVTGQMLANFARGGAAINVLAKTLDASLELIDLGTVEPMPALAGVRQLNLGRGTANIAEGPAMTTEQCGAALVAGAASVERAVAAGAQLYIGGEMGIGNTTAACALACAVLDMPAAALVGPGTGLDDAGMARKRDVIEAALARHRPACTDALETLRRLGGFEIAALTGACVAAAQQGLPILIDGYIVTVAALLAERLSPGCRAWMLFGHRSAEPGHRAVLEALRAEPLLDLGLRLGEGSGAALAVPLVRQALALHAGMATFAEAAVSDRPA
ncbi:nicotinate-nucleotide--dimethylbenzimidazole phosphoribosyltransferase [Stutzerimonas urumqiensis]|uniref:nicotinate-nucleotide--dimethylbenzimidazole phosphoribosyltransferase n=1 Tax=Stutzerimonas urumqiensis TaxID=638269 RepID=UPI000EB2E387|nr:nicotinate-nucleotide--dimethylbenzimidazole phosphoribosyltransferase [Stutzerimonas urumqiensis]